MLWHPPIGNDLLGMLLVQLSGGLGDVMSLFRGRGLCLGGFPVHQ